jgi:precorrin-6B methylase 1
MKKNPSAKVVVLDLRNRFDNESIRIISRGDIGYFGLLHTLSSK